MCNNHLHRLRSTNNNSLRYNSWFSWRIILYEIYVFYTIVGARISPDGYLLLIIMNVFKLNVVSSLLFVRPCVFFWTFTYIFWVVFFVAFQLIYFRTAF